MSIFRVIIVSILFLSLLAGCTPTTVHIHTTHIAEEQLERVRHSLESLGYQVIERENRHPSAHLGSILVYYPGHSSEEQLAQVNQAVADAGLSIDGEYPATIGPHRYTEGNIGLYLVNGQAGSSQQQDLAEEGIPLTVTDVELGSTNCDTSYLLEFDPQGKLVMTNLSDDSSEPRELEWSRDSGQLLSISDGNHNYEYSYLEYRKKRNSPSGKEYLEVSLKLEPKGFYPVPFACIYRAIQNQLVL